jgi:DNA-binding beta-propeller fold protein YncE
MGMRSGARLTAAVLASAGAVLSQLAVDPASGIVTPDFFSAQQFHERLAESRWSSGQLEYVDGAASAVLRHPYTIAHAGHDEFFVASFTLNHVLRLRWLAGKRAQYRVFVKGSELDGPVGLALREGALYVASFTNDVVLRVDAESGELLGKIGDDESLDCPEGIAFSPDGRLFVASFLLPHLSVFDPTSGAFLGHFGSADGGPPRPHPPPRAADEAGASLQILQKRADRLALHGAEDLAFDLDGNVHVTAYYANAVFKFNGTSGALETTYGKGFVRGPVGIACDPASGDLVVASYKDNKVLKFAPSGRFVGVAAGAPREQKMRDSRGKKAISSPSGVAYADDGTLWVASYTTGAVMRFNSSGGGGRTWRVIT